MARPDARRAAFMGHNGHQGGEYPLSDGVVNTVPTGVRRRSDPGAVGHTAGRNAPRGVGETSGVTLCLPEAHIMHVTPLVWTITLIVLTVVLVLDLVIIGRRPHEPTMKEAAAWVGVYVGLAVLFGLGIFLTKGPVYGGEFFAGWLTEYSLSVDNLFVFVVIMSSFAVPRIYQQRVLLFGIVLALVMRGAFIAAGAALINRFVWIFY